MPMARLDGGGLGGAVGGAGQLLDKARSSGRGRPLVAVGVDTTVGHIEKIVTYDLRDLIQTDHADGE